MENLGFAKPSNDVLYGIPREVPNVIGLTEKEAQRALNEAGFRYTKAEQVVTDPNYVKGTVVNQSPGAASKALPGSSVT